MDSIQLRPLLLGGATVVSMALFLELTSINLAALTVVALLTAYYSARLNLSSFPTKSLIYAAPEDAEVEADIIVIGAGVVGSAVSTALARDGKKVLVIERSLTEPNRIVGELLQPGGVERLNQLGLLGCIENIGACRTNGYIVVEGGRSISLDYPINQEENKAVPVGKPVQGVSFHHGRFVQNLRAACRDQEGVSLIQGTVVDLLHRDVSGVDTIVGVQFKQDGVIKSAHAPLVVSCDGHYSKFRKEIITAQPLASSSFAGIIVDDVSMDDQDRGHVILSERTPILVYPISKHQVRVLVDIMHPMPKDLKGFFTDNVAPHLPDKLRPNFLKAISEKSVRSMPCHRLHPQTHQKPGLLLMGDSLNMRHPLTGGGMTVGLGDAVLIRDVMRNVTDLKDQGAVQNALHEFYERRISHSCCINVLAQALYRVFSIYPSDHPDFLPNMDQMREACVSYFDLGPEYVAGPIGMLSGIITSPYVLIYHFTMVAFYAFSLKLKPYPTPEKIKTCLGIFSSAAILFTPLLFKEQVLAHAVSNIPFL